MAYNSRDLSVVAYANGFTLWHYRHDTDTCADIHHIDYFNEAHACGMLRKGDMVLYNGSDGDGFGFYTGPAIEGVTK